uniref:EOG090X043H n=1 Tax=Lynceus sp. MCZ IZ 141354 TaxID=1930659 RepID=A0A9N6ZFW5_9CRUS|nr:EOG090X043H [Lynceus sp. MCZ IZ 141354]
MEEYVKGERWSVFLVSSQIFKGRCKDKDPAQVERTNLVNLTKLIVKEMLESSVKHGRMLDSDYVPLQHFFIILEHALRHGLRPKKGLLGPKKELWDLFQIVERFNNEAHDITSSVRDLPTVKTHLGRARAWLRLALMQKKLADYMKILLENKENILMEYYEPGALLLSDEAVVLLGLLLGLNVVDCNLCLKEEDLDCQQGVIDFSLYLRTGSQLAETQDSVDSASMNAVLDQKNYVEELNRHLSATISNLQVKLESLTTTNTLLKEDLNLSKAAIATLQDENNQLRMSYNKGDLVLPNNSVKFVNNEDDNSELKMQLAEEKNRRLDLEKEVELQVALRAEKEVALKLVEKDIHEKQDTIVSLRRQLEDIKQINLDLYKKLRECEEDIRGKSEVVSRLEAKASHISNLLANLDKIPSSNNGTN